MQTETVSEVQEFTTRRERGTGRLWLVGKRWWIQFYDASGRQRRETSRSTKRTVAERLLLRRLGEKESGLLPKPVRKARVTVDELVRDELAYLSKNGKKGDWVGICWNLRLKEFFGGREASQIRRADLEAYQSHRMEFYCKKFPNAGSKKLLACESAVNKDLSVLRMILYCGKKLEKLDAVPPFPDKLPGAMERCGTISKAQFDAMLSACEPDETWLRTAVTMAYLWGYRLRELLNLRCFQANLADGIVYLLPRTTKNKHGRAIPISEQETELLTKCMAGKEAEQLVFTRANGSPIKDLRVRWDRLVADARAGHFEIGDAGVKTWHPAIFHDLRRTAITNMLAGGMSPENVRALAGHFSPEMLQHYNHPAMDTLRRARQLAAERLAVLEAPRLLNGANSGIVQGQEGVAIAPSLV